MIDGDVMDRMDMDGWMDGWMELVGPSVSGRWVGGW